jgi:hypothetical protein
MRRNKVRVVGLSALAIACMDLPAAHADLIQVSDLVYFTKPSLNIDGKTLLDVASAPCGGTDVLLCFFTPEATLKEVPPGKEAIAIKGALPVREDLNNPPGARLQKSKSTDTSDDLGLPKVPATGVPFLGTAFIQIRETPEQSPLSDSLTLTTMPAFPGQDPIPVAYNFFSDPASEATAAVDEQSQPITNETPNKFQDITAALFPRLDPAVFPYRVAILSDCGSDGEICETTIADVPEPSTWLLLATGLGLLGFGWHRRHLVA